MSGPNTTVSIFGNSSGGQAAVQQMTSSLNQLQSQLGQLNSTLNGLNPTLRQTGDQHRQNTSAVESHTNVLRDFGMQVASVVSGLVGFNILQDVASWFEMAIDKVKDFGQAIFDLNNETQQMQYMWQYQFGGPQNGGIGIGQQIAGWIPDFAMNSPYNWQNIMATIGPLSQLGLNFQGIQRYLPLISDLAATHTSIFGGNGPLPIQYAGLAIMEAARTGNARRLMMELQITPRELEPYGLQFMNEGSGATHGGAMKNPQMFLPALEAWAKDRGYTGASQRVAHETWWGEWSSFIDRIQKFQVEAGGTNLKGKYDKTFDQSYDDALNKQIQDAQAAGNENQVQDLEGKLDSYERLHWLFDSSYDPNSMKSMNAAQQKNYQELHRIGAPGMVNQGSFFGEMQKGLNDLSSWIDAHWQQIEKLANSLSDLGGKGLDTLRGGVTGFIQGVMDSGAGAEVGGLLQGSIDWFGDPQHQKEVQDIAHTLGTDVGGALKEVIGDVKEIKQDWKDFTGLFTDQDKADVATHLGLIADLFGHMGGQIGRALKLVDDLILGFKLLGEAMSGHADIRAMMDWEAQLANDMAQFSTGGYYNPNIMSPDQQAAANKKAQDQAAAWQKAHPQGQHKGGSGPNVDPNGYGYSLGGVTSNQNNFYSIYGATSWDVQKLIDQNAKAVGNKQNILSRIPGGLQFNVVGLF